MRGMSPFHHPQAPARHSAALTSLLPGTNPGPSLSAATRPTPARVRLNASESVSGPNDGAGVLTLVVLVCDGKDTKEEANDAEYGVKAEDATDAESYLTPSLHSNSNPNSCLNRRRKASSHPLRCGCTRECGGGKADMRGFAEAGYVGARRAERRLRWVSGGADQGEVEVEGRRGRRGGTRKEFEGTRCTPGIAAAVPAFALPGVHRRCRGHEAIKSPTRVETALALDLVMDMELMKWRRWRGRNAEDDKVDALVDVVLDANGALYLLFGVVFSWSGRGRESEGTGLEHTLNKRKTPVDSAPNLRVQHQSKERKERAVARGEERSQSPARHTAHKVSRMLMLTLILTQSTLESLELLFEVGSTSRGRREDMEVVGGGKRVEWGKQASSQGDRVRAGLQEVQQILGAHFTVQDKKELPDNTRPLPDSNGISAAS
ncbi:hypothetical protein B0H13DRAFT_1896812 [Mycena leptocephala]|nr:hypothetical protein B0H13DRAFT_1896812 [Mycena leptocephala]